MNLFYTIFRGIVYIPTKIFYPTKVINKSNNLRKQKVITISNHLKWTDILIVAVNVPGYRHVIAKKEFGNNWFLRYLCKWMGMVLVDRNAVDISSIRTSLAILKKNEGITIFPEGTRNKVGADLQEVKGGAAMFAVKGKAPILPIMIYERSKVFKKNYIYIDDSFELSDFYGKSLDSKSLEGASEIISQKMIDAKNKLTSFVDGKKSKRSKKQKQSTEKSIEE